MIPTELIGSGHMSIAALHYSLVNTKYLYGYMDLQTNTNTFSENFWQFCYTGNEKDNFPILISLVSHCYATS